MSQPEQPVELFISYAHEDEAWHDHLIEHLSSLQRQGVIRGWHDRMITAGEEWKDEIDEHLNSADIILLLISSAFFASDYCYDIELKRAMERHETEDAVVIPILLRDCDWSGAPFGKLQMLPTGAVAVDSEAWNSKDEAFKNIVQGIRVVAEKLWERQQSPPPPPVPNARPLPSRRLLPYLCDRSDQERLLGLGLKQHLQAKPNRPMICLIHGDEFECHGEFLERLRYRSLPRFLDLETKLLSVKEYPLARPPQRIPSPDVFWQHLGEALLEDSTATSQETMVFIAQHEEPLLVSLHLLTEDFAEMSEALLTRLLEFFASWPDLPAGRLVMYCVCLKYQRFDDIGFFDFRKRKLRNLNEQLRATIHGYESLSSSHLSCIVVPELESIPRSDVETWSRSEPVRRYQIGTTEIRRLYERRELCDEEGQIAMELLAPELKHLIDTKSSM
ncbi:MAG TPA: TIR domain-containing protein [Blastocatellia bacterium]|nr:TIR domain-containing protein [Blastocatellia bacterium]